MVTSSEQGKKVPHAVGAIYISGALHTEQVDEMFPNRLWPAQRKCSKNGNTSYSSHWIIPEFHSARIKFIQPVCVGTNQPEIGQRRDTIWMVDSAHAQRFAAAVSEIVLQIKFCV